MLTCIRAAPEPVVDEGQHRGQQTPRGGRDAVRRAMVGQGLTELGVIWLETGRDVHEGLADRDSMSLASGARHDLPLEPRCQGGELQTFSPTRRS